MSLRARKVVLILATLGFWATGLLLANSLEPAASTIVFVVTSLVVGAVLAIVMEGPGKWRGRFRR